MKPVKIIVVEDESIVAKDIQNTLIKLGYEVPAIASTHSAAIERIKEHKPDLVFMDIKLKGNSDGVEIAAEIKEEFDIPVIFLTSFVDKNTLERAKITEPYGYIVKPFNETDLRTAVEIALYKYSRDKEMKQSKQLYVNTLQNLSEAMVITNEKAHITFANPKAEKFSQVENLEGKHILDAFHIEPGSDQTFSKTDVTKMLMDPASRGSVSLHITQNDIKTGTVHPTVIYNEDKNVSGCALVLKENSNTGSTPKINQSVPFDNLFLSNSFFVKKGTLLVRIALDNVLWVQAMDNYVIIKTEADQFIIHSTMKEIEGKLPPNTFIRVHRSYIVSLDKITLLDENTVIVNEKTIPIGKSYRDGLMNKLNFL
jgi:DNA-binding LytR/AlgR family response regulator